MIELPDDELDKLFRKSSEELDPTYEPADWNALSKRLDQEDGRTPAAWFRKWWPVGLLALLIPVGLVSYFLLKDADSDKNVLSKTTKSVVVAPKSDAVELSDVESLGEELNNLSERDSNADVSSNDNLLNKVTEELPASGGNERESLKELSEKDSPDPKNVNPIARDKKLFTKSKIKASSDNSVLESSKILPRSRTKAGGVHLEPNRSTGQEGNGAFSSFDKKLVGRKRDEVEDNQLKEVATKKGSDNKIYSRNSNPDFENGEISTSETKNTTEKPVDASNNLVPEASRLLLSVAHLNHLPFNNKGNLALPEVKTVDLPAVEKPEKPEEKEEFAKLAIRVGYSPDLSTVGLKNFTKPKSAFSLMVEYALVRKLFIQTGISRSIKDYYANASEYDLMPYVTNINTPYNVDGTCDMLEIPLNIRYDFAQGQHSRWFAGTGFTSYNIQKEKYVYNYKTYKHGQKAGWEGKTGWYFLSHLNASVGYERRITKKLSILAEPYIRIPLKGVGYGKVNLVTTGMWLSIRYTPYFFK